MKAINQLLVVLLATNGCALAQSDPEWRATIKVVDEPGVAVTNAEVRIGYYVTPPVGQTIATSAKVGRTDTNGVFSASAHSRSVDLFFNAAKQGYYKTSVQYELGATYQYDPIKWSPSKTLVLKKIRQPVAMYAKSLNLGMPVKEKPVGFDFSVGDWTAPHGSGVNADIIFYGHLDRRSEFDSDYTLTVSFPKPGDGIQEFTVSEIEKSSELRSPYEAPAEGYQAQWVQTDSRKPKKPIKTNRDPKRNYFIRVRTVLDEKGNVKSAHYGKIYGDFMQFKYYLNPTPNDRNVEFDPKRNLLKNLKDMEQVCEP